MAQAFHPATVLVLKLGLIAAILGAFALVLLARWRMTPPAAGGTVALQPIPFSHQHHAGDDGIDCRYCHTAVERSRFAGLPSSNRGHGPVHACRAAGPVRRRLRHAACLPRAMDHAPARRGQDGSGWPEPDRFRAVRTSTTIDT